ncbi:MAG TPA: divalent-cation tolerance protein CutA, partial [Allosphingosinicella sp.]
MSAIVTVYATFPSEEEARRIARILVEERHAACANILGDCHSIYNWQGAVEETAEIAALFKTRADLADALIARLAELHSYDVPAAVAWPVSNAWLP